MNSVPPPVPDPYGTEPYGTEAGRPEPSRTDSQGQYGQPAGVGTSGEHGRYGQPNPYDRSHGGEPVGPARPSPAPTGPAPGTDLASDLGAGLKFAGRALLHNPVAYLVSGLIYTVLLVVITVGAVIVSTVVLISQLESSGYAGEPAVGEMVAFIASIVLILLLTLPVAFLWQSGAARSADVVREGGRPTIGQTLIGSGRVIVTSLLMGVIAFIGALLCYIPGLIATVMMFYAIPAALRGASPVEAIKESFGLAKNNLGTTVVAWLVMSAISYVASMTIIAVIVMVPFYVLFQVGMYERLNGRELPEPARA